MADLEKQVQEERDKANALGKEVEDKSAELSEGKVRYHAAVDACDRDRLKVCSRPASSSFTGARVPIR